MSEVLKRSEATLSQSKHATRVPEALWRIPVRYAKTAGPRDFVESSRSESKDREERRERREERREERGVTRDENAGLQFTCIF